MLLLCVVLVVTLVDSPVDSPGVTRVVVVVVAFASLTAAVTFHETDGEEGSYRQEASPEKPIIHVPPPVSHLRRVCISTFLCVVVGIPCSEPQRYKYVVCVSMLAEVYVPIVLCGRVALMGRVVIPATKGTSLPVGSNGRDRPRVSRSRVHCVCLVVR